MIKIIGIYKITNKVNGKFYIGSSKNIEARKTQHFSELRGGYHLNVFMQRSWNKYGEDSFDFSILRICDNTENILEVEQEYLDKYFDFGKNCFNLNPKSSSPPIKTKYCHLYDLKGNHVKTYSSIRECSVDLNISESTISHSFKKNFFLLKKYKVVISENSKCDIKINVDIFYRYIIMLDELNNIIGKFKDISEFCKHINENIDRNKETIINQSLNNIHKYKGYKIIYEEDFYKNLHLKSSNNKPKKYLLEYSFKGELLNVIHKKYGLKIDSSLSDNAKTNDRKRLLGRDISLTVKDKTSVFITSDEIENHIKTNIRTYVVKNVITGEVFEFLKMVDANSFLKITKSTFQSKVKSKCLVDDIYELSYKKY